MKPPIAVDESYLVTIQEFEKHMRPIGKPLVVKGWMARWKAMSEWNLEFFRTNYGKDGIHVGASIKDHRIGFQVLLRDYIDYILDPDGSLLKQLTGAIDLPRPLYPYGYKPFAQHPELLEHFQLPPFVEDWFPHFGKDFKRDHFPFQQGWLLLGPRGTVSELHGDANSTITWLAQIQGRKRCFLFSPEEENIYNGEVDPLNPDMERFPKLKHAQPYECILEPGSMLFLPPNWWHHVIALENSITLSYNLVSRINFGDYMLKVFGDRVTDMLSLLPGEID